jgi:CubicO group peptidase (beta-lactamase class C family)
LRTNVFHLPVRGSGDGGVYTTVADIDTLWQALFAGRIVSREWAAEMVRPRSDVPSSAMRYGLGFWLHASTDAVLLEGYDTGVVSQHARSRHGRHVDRHLEHHRRSLADRPPARGTIRADAPG